MGDKLDHVVMPLATGSDRGDQARDGGQATEAKRLWRSNLGTLLFRLVAGRELAG
jgi:hypothetical protein